MMLDLLTGNLLLTFFLLVLWTVVYVRIFRFCAGAAGIEKCSYFKALGTLVVSGIAGAIASSLLGFLPAGVLLGFFGGIAASAIVIAMMLDTTFWKAIQTMIFTWAMAILTFMGAAWACEKIF